MVALQSSNAPTRTSRFVQIEHVRVWTARPFAEVVTTLEAETGVFDGAAIEARIAANAPPSSVLEDIAEMAGRSGFMRFAKFDHGGTLRMQGKATEAIRFLIGHPLIASRMTTNQIASGLYAPLSLMVASDERGGTFLEYDRPSTLFGQFEDLGVSKVGRELDDKFGALIDSAAGQPVATASNS